MPVLFPFLSAYLTPLIRMCNTIAPLRLAILPLMVARISFPSCVVHLLISRSAQQEETRADGAQAGFEPRAAHG